MCFGIERENSMWFRNCLNIYLIKFTGEKVLVLRLDFCFFSIGLCWGWEVCCEFWCVVSLAFGRRLFVKLGRGA